VKRLSRKLHGADYVWVFGFDAPFWIVFGICGAIGMWEPAAAVIAFLVMGYLLYLWDRSRSSYYCVQCRTTSTYKETQNPPRVINNHIDG
jgi:hypothetical protein